MKHEFEQNSAQMIIPQGIVRKLNHQQLKKKASTANKKK